MTEGVCCALHSRHQPVRKLGGCVGTNVVCPGLHLDDRAWILYWS